MSQTMNQNESAQVPAAAPETNDVLDQLMKPEVQQSLTTLVENLPKLTEMVTVLTKFYDVANSLAGDKVFVDDIKAGFSGVAGPVIGKVKGAASAAIEANDRAQNDQSSIGLFGMLKMLKDPNVQKALRFGQAYLDILSDRNKQQR
ncbi:hypothetical protein DCC85_20985 [Paenibacillus sp. CAA11]|uniref:DUF1641 domain-containing protein n=1 Tax=Paenibacillus sp. CAA11 TaxID=1532905 RepID=UPI000D36BDD3|nr:DUF1641 domain-containing protein [Paenibacillus sp. CAA11]AWB46395.1 hypothetical protein DCC85_20985 [Paenibacillus sp. CAA11]